MSITIRLILRVVCAFGISLLSSMSIAQTSNYLHFFDSSWRTASPSVAISDGAGGAIICGSTGGAYYLRRVDNSGQELWRTLGNDPFCAIGPIKLVRTDDGAILMVGRFISTTIGGLYDYFAARFSLADGVKQWDVVRFINTDENFGMGGHGSVTFLAYPKASTLCIEGIAADGTSAWLRTEPLPPGNGLFKAAATMGSQGRFLVSTRSASATSEVDTFAYDTAGVKHWVNTTSVGRQVNGISALLSSAAGALYVAYTANRSGVFKILGPTTLWRVDLPNPTYCQRLDEGPEQVLFSQRLSNDVMFIDKIDSQTGVTSLTKSVPTVSRSLGAAPSGHYGYIEAFWGPPKAVVLNPDFSIAWERIIDTTESWGNVTGVLTPNGRTFAWSPTRDENGVREKMLLFDTLTGQEVVRTDIGFSEGSLSATAGIPSHDGGVLLMEGSGPELMGLRSLGLQGETIGTHNIEGFYERTNSVANDGSFALSLASQMTGPKFARLNQQGAFEFLLDRQYALEDVVCGANGSIFYFHRLNGQILSKCDANGTDLWHFPLWTIVDVGKWPDIEGGIVFNKYEDDSILRVSPEGRILWNRPGFRVFAEDEKTLAYFLISKHSQSGAIRIERYSAQDQLLWVKTHPSGFAGAGVFDAKVDMDGNLVVGWSGWGVASFDPSGALRWQRFFNDEQPAKLLISTINEVIVQGTVDHGPDDDFWDITCRILPNSSLGAGRYERFSSPTQEWCSDIRADFAGNIFIVGGTQRFHTQAYVWRIGSDAKLFSFEDLSVTEGIALRASSEDLKSSNDLKSYYLPDSEAGSVGLHIRATAPQAQGERLVVRIEHGAGANGIGFVAEIRNYQSGSWKRLDSVVESGSDNVVLFNTTLPGFIKPESREVEVRLKWTRINDDEPAADGWAAWLDHVGFCQK